MKNFKSLFLIIIPILFLISACQKDPVTSTTNSNISDFSGIINDEQGHIVPLAIVSAKDGAKNIVAIDTANDVGEFLLKNIPSDLSTISIDILHDEFLPATFSAKELVSSAGEKRNGILLSLTHVDSCCAYVRVSVSDEVTKNMIEGAEVRLFNKGKGDRPVTTVKTDASGKVIFENICKGIYSIRISKEGYKVDERPLIVNFCDSTIIDSRLKVSDDKGGEKKDSGCCNGVLIVIPVDEFNMPIVDADVSLASRKMKSLKTTLEGVKYTGLCEGKDIVMILKEGYGVIEFAFEMKCNGEMKETPMMKKKSDDVNNDSCCKGALLVTVIDPTDKMIVGVEVKLTRPNGKVDVSKTSDAGGASFSNLCPGKHGIRIAREGFDVVEQVFDQKCNETKLIRISLGKKITTDDSCCNGKVNLYLNNQDGKPVVGAAIKLQRPNGSTIVANSNDIGVATFSKLCAGAYLFWTGKDGYKNIEGRFSLECNATIDMKYNLTKVITGTDSCCNGQVNFSFKDEALSSSKIVSGKVSLYKDGKLLTFGTLVNGKIGFEKLCSGVYSYGFASELYKGLEGKFVLECNATFVIEVKASQNINPPNNDSCCNGKAYFSILDANGSKIGLNGKGILYLGGKVIATTPINAGKLVFEKLCPGKYGVSFNIEGYKTIETEFALECNKVYENSMKIQKNITDKPDSCNTAKLALRVKDANTKDGGWLEGVEVIVYQNGMNQIAKGNTNGEGYFKLENLIAPMTYVATFSKDGFQMNKIAVSFTECNTIYQVVDLSK